MRPKYPAETTNIYRPPEVAVRPKHPNCKNEFVFRFSYITFENENEISKKNLFFVRKFENEKGKKRYIHGPNWILRCTRTHDIFVIYYVNTNAAGLPPLQCIVTAGVLHDHALWRSAMAAPLQAVDACRRDHCWDWLLL